MSEPTLGQKISWFLYRKGMGSVKRDFLFLVRTGEPKWFEMAEELIKANDLHARTIILDQLLRTVNFRNNPKRDRYMKMAGHFLNKGVVDERRRVVQYIDNNSSLFTEKDDLLLGPLITAQRDSDIVTANTAEEVLIKIRGEVKQSREDYR